MHDRRTSPLALSLLPPARPRSRLAGDARSPRTPECASPLPTFLLAASASAARRKSSDSWNSLESADLEPDREWKHDHVTFLIRALDALPSHTFTPFNGVPPAALLDRISRGVTSAKGDDWPHTVRQTRIKLLDLARTRAKELATNSIIQEDPNSTDPGRRRPLHRQSSMDFISTAKIGTRAADRFGRLASPRASLLNPHTPSSSTLASTSGLGLGAPPPRLARRSSAMTVSSTDSCCLVDPRVQRIRRSGSFGDGPPPAPGTPPARRTLKRAPSASSSGSTKIDLGSPPEPKTRPRTSSTSSDEGGTGKKAKKARRRSPSPPPSAPPSSLPCSPEVPMTPPTPALAPVRRRRLNPARNPSMFGPELPHLAPRPCPSAFPVLYSAAAAVSAAADAERRCSPEARRVASPESLRSPDRRRSVASPESPSAPRLRRVKATTFAPVARRISFGSLRASAAAALAPAPAVDDAAPTLAGVLEDAFCLEY